MFNNCSGYRAHIINNKKRFKRNFFVSKACNFIFAFIADDKSVNIIQWLFVV